MIKLLTVLFVTTAAVAVDLRTFKIPNFLVAAGAVSGIFLRLFLGGFSGLADGIAGGALPLLLLLGLTWASVLGAGDVKLLMVIGIILGPAAVLRVMGYTGLMACVWAVLLMLSKRIFMDRMRYFVTYMTGVIKSGKVTDYITEDEIGQKKPWLMHMSVPILAGLVCELLL